MTRDKEPKTKNEQEKDLASRFVEEDLEQDDNLRASVQETKECLGDKGKLYGAD